MKKTLLVIMAGVLAVSMAAMAKGQGNRGNKEAGAEGKRNQRMMQRNRHRPARPMAGLKLTAEQKEQMKSIRESATEEMKQAKTPAEKAEVRKATAEKIRDVLTEEQRAQIDSQRQGLRRPGRHLNLSDEQKAQVQEIMSDARKEAKDAKTPEARKDIMDAAKKKVKALLTPEQLESVNDAGKNRPKARMRTKNRSASPSAEQK